MLLFKSMYFKFFKKYLHITSQKWNCLKIQDIKPTRKALYTNKFYVIDTSKLIEKMVRFALK